MWIAFAATLGAALIAAVTALWQFHRNRRLEQAKLAWEREKLSLTWLREDTAPTRQAAIEQKHEKTQTATRRAESIRRCREKTIADLSMIRILDMSRPLRLERLYIQLRVREHREPSYSAVTDLELDEGEIKRSTDFRTATTYAPADALAHFHRMVVLGDPGAGKTTMLRRLALSMATAGVTFPLYVELRTFVDSDADSLLAHYSTQYGDDLTETDFRDLLSAGQATLLLDGLDEVLGGGTAQEAAETYNRIAAEVERLAKMFPRAGIVVTCRKHGWRGGLNTFQVTEVLDFDWPQICQFIESWFDKDTERSQRLINTLSVNLRLKTLATNPLLLSLIAIVYERDLELPERRAALYRRCVEVLLREWDSHRKIKRFAKFTTDRKQDLLKQIAWQYHRHGNRYFAKDELVAVVREFLPTIDIDQSCAQEILDEIAAQYGLIKTQAQDWYGFLHLTLQEYFCAAHLLEQGPSGAEFLAARSYDPWWEEVILLFAGSTPDAAPLLKALTVDDDMFHTRLLLAGRCLTGAPRVSEPALRTKIIDEIFTLWSTSKYQSERERAAHVLVEAATTARLRERLVKSLLDNSLSEGRRMTLLTAIADMAALDFAPALTHSLHQQDNGLVLRETVQTLALLSATSAVPSIRTILTSQSADDVKLVCKLALLALDRQPGSLVALVEEARYRRWLDSPILVKLLDSSQGNINDTATSELGAVLFANGRDNFFARQPVTRRFLTTATVSQVEKILERITGGEEWLSTRVSVALSLGHQFHSFEYRSNLRTAVTKIACDISITWQIRWGMSLCLAECEVEDSTLRDIRLALDSDSWDLGQLGLALTTAQWGSLEYGSRIVGDMLSGRFGPDLDYHEGNHTWSYTGEVWDRAFHIISKFSIGDLKQITQNYINNLDPEVMSALRCLSKLDPASAADILDQLQTVNGVTWLDNYINLTEGQASRLLSRLTTPNTLDPELQPILITSIGRVISASADIRRLVDLQRGYEDPDRDVPYEALLKASRRGRLIVSRNGDIRPWDSDLLD